MSLDDDWFLNPFPESRSTTENNGDNQTFRKPVVSAKPTRKVVLRKFPGPAGILMPNSGDSTVFNSSNSEIPCTQRSMSMFENGPWDEMMKDFEPGQLPVRYNIKWIKTKATLNQLANWKAPFLAAVVQSIECSDTINVILKDMTGEIQAAVIHNLYEDHSENFKVGSVIILKHFGVLTTGQSSNHCLTITSKNLVCIYAQPEPDDEERSVRKIQLQSFDSQAFSNTSTPNASDDFDDDFQIPDGFEENALRNFELSQQSSSPQTASEDTGMSTSSSNGFELSNVPKVRGDNDHGTYSGSSNSRRSSENSLQKGTKDAAYKVSNDNIAESSFKWRNALHNSFEDTDLPLTQMSADLDQGASPKKFKFRPCKKDKPQNVIVNCSQVSVRTSTEHSSIWQSVLEDVDEDALFGDF